MKTYRYIRPIALAAAVVCSSIAIHAADFIPDRYIVALQPNADPAQVAARYGVTPTHVYTDAVRGFAGLISKARLQRLAQDADVTVIEQDRVVSLGQVASMGESGTVAATSTDYVPTGVNRIDAELNPRTDASAVGIAIIDTGISLTHPDLNVAGGVSYVRGVRSANDDNGHGSHVSGIAAAKVNDIGIRGVAPNARLFAVKVLDSTGSGSLSGVISGIDWVTKNTKTKGIQVANMSLGFQGTSSTLDSAITKSVDAGVTYVVAAGNNAADANTFSPARHPKVITISAFVDTDGQCGGAGVGTGYGADDSFASFSNYGSVVALAAPGVNIYSTYKDGGYATMSGTSMSSPHVAGAALQYIAGHAGATPAQVRSALLNAATPQSWTSCTQDATGRYRGGFFGDVDAYAEPVVDVATF